MNKELRKATFKTKKELYEILKINECYTKRKLNIDKDTVDKFFQYANDFEKHFEFFKDIVLKYTKQDEIEEVKCFVDNEEFEYIFRLAKRLYRKIYFRRNQKSKKRKNK